MIQIGRFPRTRMRRNRLNEPTRKMVAEHHLHLENLIWPIFITEADHQSGPIPSMPNVERIGLNKIAAYIEPAVKLGIPAIALFPVTPIHLRDNSGNEAINPQNIICQAAKILKKEFPDLILIGDVALDPYTSHGHDGIVVNGYVHNDLSVEKLTQQSIILADSGIDIVAPSDMMDGRVHAIREGLDEHGKVETSIMSYAAKYASAFYGPFRDALLSGKQLVGDKKTYQMDPANSREALHEASMDVDEGADMIMIKPGMPYLDIIYRVARTCPVPVFAYQVSGEYAMLSAAMNNGWLNKEQAIIESLLAFRRAGARGILTYFAVEAAKILSC